jgi:hypothetical protein
VLDRQKAVLKAGRKRALACTTVPWRDPSRHAFCGELSSSRVSRSTAVPVARCWLLSGVPGDLLERTSGMTINGGGPDARSRPCLNLTEQPPLLPSVRAATLQSCTGAGYAEYPGARQNVCVSLHEIAAPAFAAIKLQFHPRRGRPNGNGRVQRVRWGRF